MKDEIKVNKANKSITFINNGISFSQFGVADEILDLITNLQERCEYLERSNNRREDEIMSLRDECVDGETYKSRNEKANALLDEMLERAYIDGKYIMYDYSTSELLEVKQVLEGEGKDVKDKR